MTTDPDSLPLKGGEDARAPQPLNRYKLSGDVIAQLDAAGVVPDRPVLAVDADEVLLYFAAPLARFVETQGWRMALTEYRLEGAISRIEDGRPASKAEVGGLISAYFDGEARRQQVVEGAVEALAALAADPSVEAQIVVLTNVPLRARADRVACLRAQGVDYPLIANSGGKGRALRYLWDRTTAPMAFVDDSEQQLGSSARRAPGVARAHFVADASLRALTGRAPSAQISADDWASLGRGLTAALGEARPLKSQSET